MPHFDDATQAFVAHCEKNNLTYQKPSSADSEEKNGIVYLRNSHMPLARYSIKKCCIF